MFLEKKCRITRKAALLVLICACFIHGTTLFAQDSAQPGVQKIVYTEKQNSMRIKASDIRLVEEKNAD